MANGPNPELCKTWRMGFGKEFGNMAQGDNKTGTPGMNAIFIMDHNKIVRIPKTKTITYSCLVVDLCLQKADTNRMCMIAGGNLIIYVSKLMTCTADLTTEKLYGTVC